MPDTGVADTNGAVVTDPRSHKERMLAGDYYCCADPELVRMRAEATVLCRELADADPHDVALSQSILWRLFDKVGHTCIVIPPLRVDYGAFVTIGDNFYCNFDCVILDCAPVTIGNNVLLARAFSCTRPPTRPTRRTGMLARSSPSPSSLATGCGLAAAPLSTRG
eukprot:TRINITY_DN1349_c0_g1_i5.p1 TRINITY_DN1349_c0_g1~~TRINITY_DN1349_c0_g1_i5.p1  ORF type:complete len:165 (+),score=34.17 TRINITY_DN1349_c0_g1_i5:173-667(+)